MNIKDLAYELYKEDWKTNHGIFRPQEVDALKRYYDYCQENGDSIVFNDWLQEFGYHGELFVCKAEFLANEYQDESYIRQLLDSDDLFRQYQEDLTGEDATV